MLKMKRASKSTLNMPTIKMKTSSLISQQSVRPAIMEDVEPKVQKNA